MKNITSFLVIFITYTLYPQADSTQKVGSRFYGKLNPLWIYTSTSLNNPNNSVLSSFEFGKTFDAFDVGICYGSDRAFDSTQYLELKGALLAVQYHIFSSEIVMGFGKTFNKNMPLMFEYSGTLMIQVTKQVSIGIFMGYIDYRGKLIDISNNTFGFSLRFGAMRDANGFLARKMKHKSSHHFRR